MATFLFANLIEIMNSPQDEEFDGVIEPADAELADLVAYLDGELYSRSAETFERRLTEEAPLRQEADRLDRTWQLLESLEEITASREFTQRTVSSMQAIDAATTNLGIETDDEPIASGLSSATSPGKPVGLARKVLQPLAAFATSFLLCGLLIGFVEWRRLKDRPADDVEVLRNVELLENFFQINRVPDDQFLRELEIRPSDETQLPRPGKD